MPQECRVKRRNESVKQLEIWKQKLEKFGTVKWPALSPPIEFFWQFKLKASRIDVWTHLSDTSRFNREMGFSPRTQEEQAGKMVVTTTMLGMKQKWIEEPWTWLSNYTLVSTRHYLEGMAKNVHSVFHIDDEIDHRVVSIYFGWQPKNWFFSQFLKVTEQIIKKKFAQNFEKIDAVVATQIETKLPVFVALAPPFRDSSLEKVLLVEQQLLDLKLNSTIIDQLIHLITHGDSLDLEPLRILPFARTHQFDEREVLITCLHATRLGMLNISWDVICPHCRGSRYSASSLGDLPEDASCTVCDIEFSTDEANSIEVLFHVHRSIRIVEKVLFCAAEPSQKIHIKVQQHLNPGESFDVPTPLLPGHYRARFIGDAWQSRFEVTDAPSVLSFTNSTDSRKLLVIEEMKWENHALKPAQVLALSQFRDLFAEEHLNSNVKLYLGEQTILFTDIVGSTKFYHEVGDARAFAQVRSHFHEVFEEVKQQHGVVVKTIGDAVMASFASTTEAIQAATSIQERFHPHRTDTSIRLRISIHCGPVIAVQLNSGIDYFGNTVNFAAKIQSCSNAGEIALSEKAFEIYLEEPHAEFEISKRKNSRDGANADVYVLHATAQVKIA